MQEVAEASKFREKSLDNLHLLDIMFRDTVATGESAWTPSSGGLPTNFEIPVEVLGDSSDELSPQYDHDDIERLNLTQTPNSRQPPNPTQTTNPTQPLNPTQPSQEMRKKQIGTVMQSKGKKVGTVSKLLNELSKISNAVELKATSQANSNNSICDVLKRVCTLDGVEEGSGFRRMVARIFQNKEKREVFAVLEKPHLQLMFLQDEAKSIDNRYFFT